MLKKLEAYLKENCVGEKRSCSRKKLIKKFRCSDRDLRDAIHTLRVMLVPIVSNKKRGGYYYPATLEEGMIAVEYLHKYARNCYQAGLGVSKGLKKLFPNRKQLRFTME